MYSVKKINSVKALKEQLEQVKVEGWKKIFRKVKNKKYNDDRLYKISRLDISVYFTKGSYLDFIKNSDDTQDKYFQYIIDNVLPELKNEDYMIVVNDTFGVYIKD